MTFGQRTKEQKKAHHLLHILRFRVLVAREHTSERQAPFGLGLNRSGPYYTILASLERIKHLPSLTRSLY